MFWTIVTALATVATLFWLAKKGWDWYAAPEIQLYYDEQKPRVEATNYLQSPFVGVILENTGRRTAREVRVEVRKVLKKEADTWVQMSVGETTGWRLFILTPRGPRRTTVIEGEGSNGNHFVPLAWDRGPGEIRLINDMDYHIAGGGIDHKHMTIPTTDLNPGVYRVLLRAVDGDGNETQCWLTVSCERGEHVRVVASDAS